MKPTIVNKKWIAGITSAAALAGAWFAASMFRPSVGKAFTLIERPAFVFPEIIAQPGEKLMLCTNNLTGEGTVNVLIGLLDVADSTRFVAGTSPVSAQLGAQKGGCSLLLPAVMPADTNALLPAVRTGIPAVFIMDANASGGGGAGRGLVSAAHLVAADGSVRVLTTPILMENVGLPAVQR